MGIDEYGRRPRDNDPKIKAQRELEWKAFPKAQQAWDQEYGELRGEEMRRYL